MEIKTVRKENLVSDISEKTGIPSGEIARFVNVFIDVVNGHLSKGDRITLARFGTFEPKLRKGHKARDFKNKTTLEVKSHYKCRFVPAGSIVESLKKIEV